MHLSSSGTVIKTLSFLGLLSLATLSHAAESLKPGDLVGICGDSITEGKKYSIPMAEYLLMCQPQPKLTSIQFGWGGEKAPAFQARMVNDALVFKPTVVTTCYGMNDGGYVASTPAIVDTYKQSMTAIVDTFKKNGVRFIVVGAPGAVDTFYYAKRPTNPEVYNQNLADLGKAAKEVADKAGVGFADVHGTMIEVMAKAKAAQGEKFAFAGMDGVHPQEAGGLVMAYTFLKALGCDGAIATIDVDLKAGKATGTEGTKVVSFENGTVKIESTRYPFCFYGDAKDFTATRSILPYLPFNEELNRYLLVVKNAPAKSLKVTWGKESKTFSAEALEKGVNLAAEFLDNPFSEPFKAVQAKVQAQEAAETIFSKQMLHQLPDWSKALPEMKDSFDKMPAAIQAKWEALSNESAAAVVPVNHEIKIEAETK